MVSKISSAQHKILSSSNEQNGTCTYEQMWPLPYMESTRGPLIECHQKKLALFYFCSAWDHNFLLKRNIRVLKSMLKASSFDNMDMFEAVVNSIMTLSTTHS
jgi:hypothetical protein